MAVLLGVTTDESGGLQENDFGLLPTVSKPAPLSTAITDLGVNPTGVVVALSGVSGSTPSGDPVPLTTANIQDIGFRASVYAGGLDSGLTTTDGHKIFLFSYFDPLNPTQVKDNNVLVGRVSMGGLAEASGQVAFVLYLDTLGTASDTSSDAGANAVQLWLFQLQPIRHNLDGLDPNDTVSIDPSKLVVDVNSLIKFDATGAPSGQNVFLMIGDTNPAAGEVGIVVTSTDPLAQSGGGVNSSQGSGGMTLGVGSQQIDPGKGLNISFVKLSQEGVDNYVVPKLSATEAANPANIKFDGFYGAGQGPQVTSASFNMAQMQPNNGGATLRVKAIAEADNSETGAAYIPGLTDGDETTISITKVTITRTVVSGNKTDTKTLTFTADGTNTSFGFSSSILKNNPSAATVSVDFENSDPQHVTLKIIGARQGDHIVYETASGHDRVLIQNIGDTTNADLNARFDVGDFKLDSGGVTPLPIDHVTFVDDGPTANGTAQTGAVDEDGLSNGLPGGPGDQVYNADGDNNEAVAIGSVVPIFNAGRDGLAQGKGGYMLSEDTSGLTQTLTSAGEAVKYVVGGNFFGGALTAFVDTGPAGLDDGDRRVFTFALNRSTGAYTFTLLDQLDHPTTGTESDKRDIDLSPILYVIDGDNDKATAPAGKLVISVYDDSPDPLAPGDITVNNVANATANATLGYAGKVGADEPGTVKFVGTDGSQLQGHVHKAPNPPLSNLLFDGKPIYLFGFGTGTLVATTDATNADAAARIFQMTLSPGTDKYDITMLKTLTNTEDVDFGSFVAHVASGNPLTLMVPNIGGTTVDALFNGFESSTQTTVNVSQAGVGVGSGQDFNLNDRMTIQFLQDTGDEQLQIGEAQNINRFTFVMNQNNPPNDDGDLLVRAYDPNSLAAMSDDVEDQITGILVNGQALVFLQNGVVTINAAGVASKDSEGPVTAVASGKGFALHGLGGGTAGNKNDNDTVTIITADGYQRIDITATGNDTNKDTFDILLKSVALPVRYDLDFSVQANLVDQDGDPSAAQNLDVTLVGVAP